MRSTVLCHFLLVLCPTEVVLSSLTITRKLLRLMLLSSPSSVRFHRTSYAIIKASVTVWLFFPPSLHPYIGLQIPPLDCGRILLQYRCHCPTGCSVDSAAQAACANPIHFTRQPTSSNPNPLAKHPSIQPPRLEDGVYPRRSHSAFHYFLTRGAMACLSA